jgi:hypothetical protein
MVDDSINYSECETIITSAIDDLAGWWLVPISDLQKTGFNTGEALKNYPIPGSLNPLVLDAYVSVMGAHLMLFSGSVGQLPIRDAVVVANTLLEHALGIVLTLKCD